MFEQMTTFVRIAEMGSITRAARSLGLSLPMASRHLRWLEKELGIALVHRTTRQLHLTDAGQEFATRARALLVGLDDANVAGGNARVWTMETGTQNHAALPLFQHIDGIPDPNQTEKQRDQKAIH